ncbi:hypothetical protein [Curtobacterium sp. MCBA15_008]|uniref:hypothetical protein n=1 Tax=Curtobacterium sp. MCBA15_008 TaxID=1898736 RepID=UPI00111383B2|nr:hypothetical protein [Curtobacterium sp. MCBA15_008]
MASRTTHRSEVVYRSPAGPGVAVGTLLILAPIGAMALAGAAVKGFDSASLIVLAVVLSTLISAMVLASRAAAFVRCSRELVTVGVAPFWRSRLLRRDIVELAVVRVDAYADYGGWGIKGSARSSRGRLYSVGGTDTVQIVMRDGRRYFVTFKDSATPDRVCGALQSGS